MTLSYCRTFSSALVMACGSGMRSRRCGPICISIIRMNLNGISHWLAIACSPTKRFLKTQLGHSLTQNPMLESLQWVAVAVAEDAFGEATHIGVELLVVGDGAEVATVEEDFYGFFRDDGGGEL